MILAYLVVTVLITIRILIMILRTVLRYVINLFNFNFIRFLAHVFGTTIVGTTNCLAT